MGYSIGHAQCSRLRLWLHYLSVRLTPVTQHSEDKQELIKREIK